jgi:hypothetical protein
MTLHDAEHSIHPEGKERVLASKEQAMAWYESCLERFGKMTVEAADLTDGNKWKATLTENGEVEEVNGAFFTLKGQTITRYNPDGTVAFKWTQPGLIQNESVFIMPGKDGEKEVKASGFIGMIFDTHGNMLLTAAQEPFNDKNKKVVFRTPLQTSAEKLQGIMNGKRELDPTLFDLLQSFGGTGDIREVFARGDIDIFELPSADGNRIKSSNIGFALIISDPELRNSLENDLTRWVAPNVVPLLSREGIVNGHTIHAIYNAGGKA